MMPAVTEWSRPNGEPIAIAHCPGLSALESPMRSAGNPVAGILSSATSDCSSLPTTLAVNSRSEEHTSELQSLMRISYAVFCLKKKKLTADTKKETHP